MTVDPAQPVVRSSICLFCCFFSRIFCHHESFIVVWNGEQEHWEEWHRALGEKKYFFFMRV